jgi:PAS domain S-box-containing protein
MSYLPYSIIFIFISIISICLGIYGFLHRDKPGMAAFSIFMFLFAIWPMVEAFDVATADLTFKILLMKLRFDAPIFAGLAYLVMVLQLIGHSKWVTKQRLFILAIIPILGAILNWTSPNLLFRYDFHVSLNGPFPVLLWSNGPFFGIYILYLTALYLVPIFLLANSYRTISPLSSRKILILISATLIPLLTNLLFQIGITPIVGFNFTPFTEVFLGLIIAWGVFYVKAFDTVPIARSKIISSMEDGLVVFDLQGKILDINPSAKQMIGHTAQSAIGKSAYEIFSPWPDLITRFKDVDEEHTEITVKNPLRYFDMNIISLKQKKEPIGRMVILRDITTHKKADIALINSENRYRTLFGNMLEGFAFCKMIFDDDDKPVDWIYLDVNTAFEEITGIENIDGKKVTEAIPGIKESDPELFEIYGRVVLTRKPETLEINFKPLNKWLNISVFSPEKEHFVAVFEDITERKQKEEILKQTMDELKRSNKELQRFAYVSSHDLQEPLRMVTLFSQLLEKRYKDRLDKDADEFIEYIVEGAQRMKQLIDDLLSYSRVTSNTEEFEEVKLETILDTVLSNLSISIIEYNVTITNDSLPTIHADPSQIGQVFQNLIINAIKFHGPKPPEIHISAFKEEQEWIFGVTDNGIGIDKDHQEQIFEVFKRLHTREEYPGTGIGLSIVKKIINHHGGRIWVESELGKGTTFYFTIPKLAPDKFN